METMTKKHDIEYRPKDNMFILNEYKIEIPKDFIKGYVGSYMRDDRYVIELNANNSDTLTITSINNCMDCISDLYIELNVKDFKESEDKINKEDKPKNKFLSLFKI